MRSVFFGTPEIAVPALEALHATSSVVGVVCQPDRPAGRGMSLQAPSVKQAALRLGLEVHQPLKVRTGTLHEWLRERDVDVAVVLAYGRILPRAVLNAPRYGCINLHASVLPRWRGAAPIQWAIMSGDEETGVSLMRMEEGLDTGPVYTARRVPIAPLETGGELCERLARLCAQMVRDDLPDALQGRLVPTPQDDALATYAPPITHDHCAVNFDTPAHDIANHIRALSPKPGVRAWLRGKCFKLVSARVVADTVQGPPGRVTIDSGARILVATGAGTLELLYGQPEGRKVCASRDLINGRAIQDGASFTSQPPGPS